MIFICTFDPFGKGLGRYTFGEFCEEKPELRLGDGTTKIFYNCDYKGNDIPEDLRMLYYYVETGNAEDELTRRIDAAVIKGRKNAEWRSQYMKEQVLLMDAKEEGREEEATLRISNMLKKGKTVDEIVELCDYPREQVEKVEKELFSLTE